MSETNGYISPYVGDGYDELVTIPAVPGRWSAVQVRFRRLSKDEESLIFAKKNLDPLSSLARLYAEVFVGGNGKKAKLLGWDLKRKNAQGELEPLPISVETICGLAPTFFDTLLGYVEGSILTESGETQAEADVKNS